MIKYYLIFAILILSIILAIFVYLRYYFRQQLYGDLNYICRYLKNNISFKKENISSLLSSKSMHISYNTRKLISGSGRQLMYKKEDEEMVVAFVNSLGKGDVDFEINNIDYYMKEFEENYRVSKENLHKNGVVYFKIIIGLGLCVCIMLL